MSGINQSKVTVTLRNPLDHNDLLEYYIIPNDTQLAQDWIVALTSELRSNRQLEKNYCFIGFPKTARTLPYLCDELNKAVYRINMFNREGVWEQAGLQPYVIEDYYTPNTVRFGDEYPIKWGGSDVTQLGLDVKHGVMNTLHNYFEILQGTVEELSQYYITADYETKYAIRQLNILCHEIESLVLSNRKAVSAPEWLRPSQITTFLQASRYSLEPQHRTGFATNGYDRKFGHVYMHWAQIGKTLFEVFRDEHAPDIDHTTCDAINHLHYYSGEFDVEWGANITYGSNFPWHTVEQDNFKQWLIKNNLDPADINLSLGYLPIGEIALQESFGATDTFSVWDKLSSHLDIYKIEVNGVTGVFDYCWTDVNYKQQQIEQMKPGYDYSSRKGEVR
jgi:hypothetical protein